MNASTRELPCIVVSPRWPGLRARAGAALADIRIGVIASSTGPGASMGSLYRSTVPLLPKTLGGRAVEYIALDDATDPSAAVRTARKLVTENKVDAIIGPSNVPTSLAVTEVAREAQTPQLSLAPITVNPDRAAWIFVIATASTSWSSR